MLKEVTDFMKIDINKVTVSDSIPCYNGKNSRYVLRYLTNERAIRRLFIRLTSTVLTIAITKVVSLSRFVQRRKIPSLHKVVDINKVLDLITT